MLASQVFFKGQMEYAIISSRLVRKFAHGYFMCYYLFFLKVTGITYILLIFTGVRFGKRSTSRELKVRHDEYHFYDIKFIDMARFIIHHLF